MIDQSQRIAYIPQTAFLISGTIEDNILMGEPEDQSRLDKAIKASALDEDLRLWKHGLSTEVGENGVALSGGQQQRISIARAVYSDPDLLIADDVLSAVDGRVAQRIFAGLFLRYTQPATSTEYNFDNLKACVLVYYPNWIIRHVPCTVSPMSNGRASAPK